MTIRELMIGEFTELGLQGLYYLATGPLLFCIIYFVHRKEWARRNGPLYFKEGEAAGGRKVLTRTWDNKLDCWTFVVVALSAGFQIFIFISVIFAFKYARLAGLNIGIITAIWSFVPFSVAVLERILYGIGI